MNYRTIQRLQNSPLAQWMWRYWRNNLTGEITILPFWKHPGNDWKRMKYS